MRDSGLGYGVLGFRPSLEGFGLRAEGSGLSGFT